LGQSFSRCIRIRQRHRCNQAIFSCSVSLFKVLDLIAACGRTLVLSLFAIDIAVAVAV